MANAPSRRFASPGTRRRAAVLWIALLLLPAAAPGMVRCRSWNRYPHPGISWVVVSPEGIQSRLLGTMHTDDARATILARRAVPLLRGAKALVMETELTPQAAQRIQDAMRLPDGNLESIIGPRLYARAAAVFARRGWPQPLLEHTQPWALAVMLGTPEIHGPVVDQILAQAAGDDRIPVIGLETTREQIAALAGFPLATQKMLLRETLDQAHQQRLFGRLVTAYHRQDLRALVALSDLHRPDPLDRRFYHRLLHDRNQRMVRHLLPVLRRAPAFVAVGALHLPGFLTRLRRAGFCAYPAPLEDPILTKNNDSGRSP